MGAQPYPGLDIRLLGPVEARVDGRPLPFNRRQQRRLLAVLALQRGQVVPGSRLVDLLWGDRPPHAASTMLQSHISRIRAALRGAGSQDAELVGHPGGYELRAPETAVDVDRFRATVDRARAPAAVAERRALLDEALGMWRGPALVDMATEPLCRSICAELDELRISVLEERLDADLVLGRYHDVIGELRRCIAEPPLRKRLTAQLMLALYQVGRGTDALDVFSGYRTDLAERLGADSGPAVQRLHTAILRGDPVAGKPAPGTAAVARRDVPAQLPAGQPAFQGRGTELAQLDAALSTPESAPPVVLTGPAGVGKTALAVHWARRAIERFPDGQLFVDLAGHGEGTAVDPGEALLHILQSLRIAAERIPADLGGRSALFRSVLANRRALVVLDNAADANQVAPLLPGGGTGVVVITSRSRLVALSMHQATHTIELDLLPRTDAVAILRTLDAASDAADRRLPYEELAASCGDLPLALQVVGAKLRFGCPPRVLADELAGEENRLDGLSVEPGGGGIRTALRWSYRKLPAPAARALRLLAARPGPVFHADHVRALTGGSPPGAGDPLLELADAHLVTPAGAGWYRLHDLVRLFAAERLRQEEQPAEQRAAVDRLLDWYQRLAAQANAVLTPHRRLVAVADPERGGPDRLTGVREVMTRLDAEWPNLLAAAVLAAQTGRDRAVWRLYYLVNGYVTRREKWHDDIRLGRLAMAATGRLGDRRARAATNHNLGRATMMLHRHDESLAYFRAALRLRPSDDVTGRIRSWSSMGACLERQGDNNAAVVAFRQALELLSHRSEPREAAVARNNLGWVYTKLGRHEDALAELRAGLGLAGAHGDRQVEAVTILHIATVELARDQADASEEHLMRALELARAADCRHTEAEVIGTLAEAARKRARYGEAIAHLSREVDMRRVAGDRHAEAVALARLGRLHLEAGRPEAARRTLEEALSVRRELPDSYHEAAIHQTLAEVAVAPGREQSATSPGSEIRALVPEAAARCGSLDG